jgi:hypothetical protein
MAILIRPELTNAPYRTLADQADVALGTLAGCMNDLTARGLLLDGKGGRQVADRQAPNFRKPRNPERSDRSTSRASWKSVDHRASRSARDPGGRRRTPVTPDLLTYAELRYRGMGQALEAAEPLLPRVLDGGIDAQIVYGLD